MGISMLTLRPGQVGGSETYARALAAALAEHGELEYRCFVPRAAADAGDGLPTVVVDEVRRADTTARKAASMALAAVRPQPILRRFRGVRAMHYPFTIPVPAARVPTAVTLHDVLHLDEPRLCPLSERLFRRFAYDRPARRADVVIVPSEYVRRRACERLGLDPRRVRTIHHGVDHAVFRPGTDEPEPFVIYPAREWPHKNHGRLFVAWERFRASRPEFELVLTGARLAGALPQGVQALGRVDLPRLADLLRRATGLVFPSLHEGFGLPALEAMASGCPVAASNASSLPETCGDAAVLFDPMDVEAMARAFAGVVDRRDELRARGLEHAARFTWEATARAHEAAYRELLGAGA